MAFENGTIRPRYWVDPSGRQARASLPLPSREFMAAATVYIAVVFNFVLAIVNAHTFGLSKTSIIVAEMLIVGTAIAVCARSLNRLMIPWLVVISALAILFIFISMFRQSLEAKYFRDVLLIPVFIMLGTTFAKGNIVRLFIVLQGTVMAVMIFEGASPILFGDLTNPQSYYINTRDFVAEDFWNRDSNLFVSAMRPPGMGQFIPGLDIFGITTRLSSVFLEPVTTGNWATVAVIFMTAFWRMLTRKETIFLILSTLAILVGSDGRFATVTTLIILAVAMILRILPRYAYALYLPGAFVAAIVVGIFFESSARVDDFLGRLAFSVWVFTSIDFWNAVGIGLSPQLLGRSFDSGITYFVVTQSFLGVFVIWLAICFLQPQTNRTAIAFMNGLAIYVSLSLLISYSMFSIKTAAPLWFLYGYIRTLSYAQMVQEDPNPVPYRSSIRR
jgi:putative polymerase